MSIPGRSASQIHASNPAGPLSGEEIIVGTQFGASVGMKTGEIGSLSGLNEGRLSARSYGAIGDGILHTVQEWIIPGALGRYADLAEVQTHYPHVVATTDPIDWAAIQQAANLAAIQGKGLTLPAGIFRLGTRQVILTGFLASNERYNCPQVGGAGIHTTFVKYDGTDYAFQITSPYAAVDGPHYADNGYFHDFTVWAETGGGFIFVGAGGGGYVWDRWGMYGCGTGKWAIDQSAEPTKTSLYPCLIQSCRFTHNGNEYKGGILKSGASLAMHVNNCFISRQMKDGPIFEIKNAETVSFYNDVFEHTNPAAPNSVFIYLTGFTTGFSLRDSRTEGHCKRMILTEAAGGVTNGIIENLDWWTYDDGPTTPVVLDLGDSAGNRNWYVKGLSYKNANPVGGGGYIINDPYGDVKEISGFLNQSTGQQLQRYLSQLWTAYDGTTVFNVFSPDVAPGTRLFTAPTAGAGNVKTVRLFLPTDVDAYILATAVDINKCKPGLYWLTVTIMEPSGLGMTTQEYRVLYGDYAADYNAVQAIGTAMNTGGAGLVPTLGAVTVSKEGVVTVPFTQGASAGGNHVVWYSWGPLHSIA